MSITDAIDTHFIGLSRGAQAVLAYSAILALRTKDAQACIADVRSALGLNEAEWEEIHSELYAAGVAWKAGDIAEYLDGTPFPNLGSAVADELTRLSVGPATRPKAKDWNALRETVFAYHFENMTEHCIYCRAEGVPLVLDHIVPIAKGGSNHPTNLFPACEPCNTSKGAKLFAEWVTPERVRG